MVVCEGYFLEEGCEERKEFGGGERVDIEGLVRIEW